jgi:hypothetical protein
MTPPKTFCTIKIKFLNIVKYVPFLNLFILIPVFTVHVHYQEYSPSRGYNLYYVHTFLPGNLKVSTIEKCPLI